MVDSSSETLAVLVTRIIRHNKLTLDDVSSNSGGRIAKSYISDIASGKAANPTVEILDALAAGLGVEPHDLFDVAVGRVRGQSPKPILPFLPDTLLLLRLMEKLVLNPLVMGMLQAVIALPVEDQLIAAKFAQDLKQSLSLRRKSRQKRRPS